MSVKFTSYRKEVEAAVKQAITAALEVVGGTAERHVKEITPVDTGRLRNSITHAPVSSDTEMVGTGVEYSVYVEFGTSKMAAQPYLRPGVESHASEYADIIKSMLPK